MKEQWRYLFVRKYVTHWEMWDIMSGDWGDSNLDPTVTFAPHELGGATERYDVRHMYFHTKGEAGRFTDSVFEWVNSRFVHGTLQVVHLHAETDLL